MRLSDWIEEPHEGHDLMLNSPHAAAKRAASAYARMFSALGDVRVIMLPQLLATHVGRRGRASRWCAEKTAETRLLGLGKPVDTVDDRFSLNNASNQSRMLRTRGPY
jgi:hypothetical protein